MSHIVDYLLHWSPIAFALCIKRSPSTGTILTYSEYRPTYCITCQKISPKINYRLQQWKKRQQISWKHTNKRRRPVTFILTDVETKLIYPTRTSEVAYKEPLWLKCCTYSAVLSMVATEADKRRTDSSRLAKNKGYLVLLLNGTISNE
jgi:hypothetical protein